MNKDTGNGKGRVTDCILDQSAAPVQPVACFCHWFTRFRGSIPGEAENFIMTILNFGARRGGDVQLIIVRL